MKRASMKRIRKIIELSKVQNISIRTIARAVNLSRPVVTNYLTLFKSSGLSTDEIEKLNDDDLLLILNNKKSCRTDRYLKLSEKFIYYSEELKKPHVTIQKLWEEYITENPTGFGRSQFCYYFQNWRKSCELTMHIEHKYGDKMFVDFTGKHLFITDRKTGEKSPAETFVAILPASHYTFACAVENQKSPNWIKANEEALWYFGGSPGAIVPDCLKSAVTKYQRYEPDINPEYSRFAEHYRTVILPARPLHPDDKALVENAVKIVYNWIYASLRNETFYSLNELNNAIFKQLEIYNAKKMQVSGLSRVELFKKHEAIALKNLPIDLYQPKSYSKMTIQSNYHVLLSEDKHYYSVHYRYYSKSQLDKKEKAEIVYTEDSVEIYYKNERIAFHKRVKTRNGYTTDELHMPERHRVYLERWNPEKIIALAKLKGEDVSLLVEKIIAGHKHPEQSYNTCRGIIFLSKTFGEVRLNKACKKALYFNRHSYKAVHEILKSHGEDFQEQPALFENKMPEHANLRGAEYYQKQIKECILQ